MFRWVLQCWLHQSENVPNFMVNQAVSCITLQATNMHTVFVCFRNPQNYDTDYRISPCLFHRSCVSHGAHNYMTQWWNTAGEGATMTDSCVQINQPLFVSQSLCSTWNLWLRYTVEEHNRRAVSYTHLRAHET